MFETDVIWTVTSPAETPTLCATAAATAARLDEGMYAWHMTLDELTDSPSVPVAEGADSAGVEMVGGGAEPSGAGAS